MKKLLLLFITFLLVLTGSGQQLTENPISGSTGTKSPVIPNADAKSLFRCDCATNFWSVDQNGIIQQWTLKNGAVTGGDAILIGSGHSLAYYNDGVNERFYSTLGGGTTEGITWYNGSDWEVLNTPVEMINNGAGRNARYFMSTVGPYTKLLYYFDGSHFSKVHEVPTGYFLVADIAVDALDRAWLVTGEYPNASYLEVYNSTSFIEKYKISFNTFNAYGSFFLGKKMHIAIRDSIFPIGIIGDSAFLEPGYYFPEGDLRDLADCVSSFHVEGLTDETKPALAVFPNPTVNKVQFRFPETFSSAGYTLTDQTGKIVQAGTVSKESPSILTEGLPPGTYFVTIEGVIIQPVRFVKE